MLRHQDLPIHAYEGQGGAGGSAALLQNRKSDKDGNFNFLSGKDDDGVMATRNGGGDENRNQVRPRTLSPLGLEPSSPSSSSGFHHGLGPLSPLSRLPCWSPLEPLPEVESGDDGYGRVPPDGAEERKMTEEEMRRGVMLTSNDKKERETRQGTPQERRGKAEFRGGELQEEEEGLDDDSEWGESDSEFGFSLRSTGSLSSLNMESGTEGVLMGGWDRIGVGEPRPDHHSGGASDTSTITATTADPTRKWDGGNKGPTGRRITSFGRETLPGTGLGTSSLEELEEEEEDKEGDREEEEEDQSSDSDDELPELMDAVWTLRDRERFKAQEMEKHQVQLTMYRRLALIRWVRTLQGRVQEQQNRLQSSFDVILTHRKELLRMGAAAAVTSAPPTATVGQS